MVRVKENLRERLYITEMSRRKKDNLGRFKISKMNNKIKVNDCKIVKTRILYKKERLNKKKKKVSNEHSTKE